MAVHNPYWDAVKEYESVDIRPWGTVERYVDPMSSIGNIGQMDRLELKRAMDNIPHRHNMVSEYSWTIPDPASVAFVYQHCAGHKILDPLAGTGYWANLLSQMGVDIIAADAAPGTNGWHKGKELHYPMFTDDAVDSVLMHRDRMIILSWIPYGSDLGTEVLENYALNRFITIGEEDFGCCGTEEFWAGVRKGWDEIASHRPIQWFGMHDFITVWERKALTA